MKVNFLIFRVKKFKKITNLEIWIKQKKRELLLKIRAQNCQVYKKIINNIHKKWKIKENELIFINKI